LYVNDSSSEYRAALFTTVGKVLRFNIGSSALIRLKMEISKTADAECRLTTGTVRSTTPKTNLDVLFVTSKVTIMQ
jgi:hypothetical protein